MTIDFKKIVIKRQDEQGYCNIDPVVMPRELNALRDNKPVKVTLGVRYRDAYSGSDLTVMTPVLTVVEGSVTGYEAWDIPHLIECGIIDNPRSDRFWACAGGMGWPSLTLATSDVQQYITDFQAQEIKFTH